MGFYHLNLDELSEYTGKTVDALKGESYQTLEKMIEDMKAAKFIDQNNKNATDDEFERLVLKYFQPLPLLRHWFDDKEIVLACAMTGVTEGRLCDKINVKPGLTCHHPNAEYIRTSVESVAQYDRYGRELIERKYEKRDVYRIASQYQGLCHGNVILHLLYERYPELEKFKFSAYSMSYGSEYEIYSGNNIYVPFAALMDGNIDAILFRNREYCKWYNNGRYSPAECEKAFHTDISHELFDIIRQVGEQERAAGHNSFHMNTNGKLASVDNMIQTKTSASGNIDFLMEQLRTTNQPSKCRFRLKYAAPYTVEQLVSEFLEMTNYQTINIHVCHITDYLGERGINVKIDRNKNMDVYKNELSISGYVVHNTFGWSYGNTADLTIRINCPEINEQ